MAGRQQTTTQEAPQLNPGDQHWDDKFNATASGLKNAETASSGMDDFEKSYNNPTASSTEESAVSRARDILKSKEEQGGSNTVTPTEGAWANKVIPKTITNQNQLAKVLLKRGGPAGAILAVVLVAGSLLGGLIGPGSLLLNLKENLTLHWDQQSYTTEIRSRSIIARRLSNKTTSGSCGTVVLLCKYEKPSNRMLNELDKANIKAVRKDGSIIERQKLLGGERPEYYFYTENLDEAALKKAVASGDISGYKFIKAANFADEMASNTAFRSAFRRAYNPRWVNWVDDAGLAFLNRMGVTKNVSKNMADAADPDSFNKAIEDTFDGKSGALGDTEDAAQKAITEIVDTEVEKAVETGSKDMMKKSGGDAVLMAAAAGCLGTQAPGVFTSAVRKIRLAEMVAVIFPLFVAIDQIKAGDGTAQLAENFGNRLTETTNTTDSAGNIVRSKSAMDSGAIKYGLLGDRVSAKNSTTVKKYIPGYTGNSLLDQAASLGQTKELKQTCNAVTSTEAQVAMDAVKVAETSNPLGWIALAISGGILVADKLGAIDYVVKNVVTPVVQRGVEMIGKAINWQDMVKNMMSGLISGARYEEFGDMIGVMASFFGDASSATTGTYLTPAQKVAFDQTVVNPTKLAWAQEDRLTRSPFDASSPNTFLGSITTQLIPYYSSISSFTGMFTSAFKLVGSMPSAFIAPNAYADETEADWTNQCTADSCDFALANSGAAVGPLGDVQSAIPTKYINTDPETVAQNLYDNHQIDADGNPVGGSDYENWIAMCTTGSTYAITECMIPDANGVADSTSKSGVSLASAEQDAQQKAYFAIYHTDQRVINGMDNEPQTSSSTSDGTSTGGTSGTDNSAVPSGTCPTGTSIVNGITAGWGKDSGTQKNITLCSIPNTKMDVFGYWKNSNYKGTSSLGINTITVNSEAAASFKQLADKYKSDTGKELHASIAYRSIWEQCSFFAPGAEKKNTVDGSQKSLYDKYCQPGISAGWLKGHGGDWTTSYVTSNHELGYSVDFTDASVKKWLKDCVNDATDGKSDNRCYNIYDDVFQREKWDAGHFTYAPK